MSGTTGYLATVLTHAGVELGLMFVHRRMQPYMEVKNVPELVPSLKVATFKSAQVKSTGTNSNLNFLYI